MIPVPLPRRLVYASAAVAVATAGGVGAAAALVTGGSGGGANVSADGSSAAGHGAPSSPAPPVQVSVAGLGTDDTIAFGKTVTLDAIDGTLASVTVTDAGGATIAGALSADARTWTSTRGLPPSGRFAVVADTINADRKHATVHLSFSTTAATRDEQLRAIVAPAGGTYGVGMPVVVTFNHDVPTGDRATVEGRFRVTNSAHQIGAWHWMDARTAHWRPAQLWHAHSTVSVRWNLAKLRVEGHWGDPASHDAEFKIGDAHVTTVDVTGHYMAVRTNGSVVKEVPVSTGRAQYASKGGPHIVLSKQPVVIMDSATVGIPKGNPDYYYEKVYWDTRVSNGGMFVHAAPWSVKDQGVLNVSHGCVNVTPDAAKWFYYYSQVGDVVNVIHASAQPDLWDAGTADWTIPWSQWLAQDPAHPDLPSNVGTDPALLQGVPGHGGYAPGPATVTTPPPPTHTTVKPSPTTHSPSPVTHTPTGSPTTTPPTHSASPTRSTSSPTPTH